MFTVTAASARNFHAILRVRLKSRARGGDVVDRQATEWERRMCLRRPWWSSDEIPVPAWVAVTSAPATTAPLESVTVPLMLPKPLRRQPAWNANAYRANGCKTTDHLRKALMIAS